jgi:hypothetical protein
MTRRRLSGMIAVLALALGVHFGTAGKLNALSSAPSVSPREILQQAVDYLKSSPNLEVVAEIEYEVLLGPALVAQRSGKLTVQIGRPDRLFVAYRDHSESKKLWFDGKNATCLDVLTSHFAKEPGKEMIEATVFELHQKYGLALPLTNLLFSRTFPEIFANAHAIHYLGTASMSGVPVHHIVAHGDIVDIQVWVESGDKPVIRKMVTINHSLPHAPRYSAKFTKFEHPEKFSGNPFSPVLPEVSHSKLYPLAEGFRVNV